MRTRNRVISFKPSSACNAHYICINGKSTGEVVNLDAYKRLMTYRNEVNERIETLIEK